MSKSGKGICACCFEPIEEGEGFQYSENGRNFHKNCVEAKPNSYYMAIERIRAKFEKRNPKSYAELMTEMEQIFDIPMMNDESFNKEHEEVMELYKKISNAREI